jgi:hypothetical protein
MRNAYQRLFGKDILDRFDAMYIHARIEQPCRIHFSTVGDRTCVGSMTNYRNENGLELYDHNVDTPHQQIVLLIGLASMHAIARREGY